MYPGGQIMVIYGEFSSFRHSVVLLTLFPGHLYGFWSTWRRTRRHIVLCISRFTSLTTMCFHPAVVLGCLCPNPRLIYCTWGRASDKSPPPDPPQEAPSRPWGAGRRRFKDRLIRRLRTTGMLFTVNENPRTDLENTLTFSPQLRAVCHQSFVLCLITRVLSPHNVFLSPVICLNATGRIFT